MNVIKSWYAKHTITSKSVAAAWLFITGMYAAQPAFHDFVVNVYTKMPKSIHEIIAGVLIPGLLFYKAEKGQIITPPSNPATLNAR